MRVRIVLLAVGSLLLVAGCPQAREDAAMQSAKAIMLKMVDKAKIDHSQMSADAAVINPEYEYDFFGGTGVYSKGKVRVIGVNVSGSVRGAGVGEAEPDSDMREKLWQILQRSDIAREERKAMLLEAVLSWVTKDPLRGQVADILMDSDLSAEEQLDQIRSLVE